MRIMLTHYQKAQLENLPCQMIQILYMDIVNVEKTRKDEIPHTCKNIFIISHSRTLTNIQNKLTHAYVLT
jgi:hypothetical protein